MLYRGVGYAQIRIYNVRLGNGLGRTGIETLGTGTALVRDWSIGIQVHINDKLSNKKPAAVLRRDKIAVFTYPS